MERHFQYYVPFSNHTQYRARARARAREHNNTMEKCILNFTHLFHVYEHSYVHIYYFFNFEDMHTKKVLLNEAFLVKIAYSNFMPTFHGFRCQLGIHIAAQKQLVAFEAGK